MSSISARVLKGSFWVTLTRLFTNGLAVLSTFILAWNLSPADFGLVAIGTTVLVILTSVTEFSLSQALVRHEAPDETHLSAAWTLNALRGAVLCLLVCGAAWPVAAFFADARLKGIMFALGASLFIGGLANPKLAMAQRSLEYWQYFTVSTGEKLVGFAVAVAVAVIYKSYWALVVGSLATQLANVSLSYVVMPFRPRILFRYFREFFGFSGWLMGSQFLSTINYNVDQLIVGAALGKAELGAYNVGGKLAQLPSREALAPLTQPLFPAFSLFSRTPDRLSAAYQRAQMLVTFGALPVSLGVALFAAPLVSLLLGAQWQSAIPVVQLVAFSTAFETLGSLVGPLAMATGRTNIFFARNLQKLVIRIPMILIGLLAGGLTGLLWGRMLSGLVTVFVDLRFVAQILQQTIWQQIAINGRSLVASIVMIFAALGLDKARPSIPLFGNDVAFLLIGGGSSVLIYVLTSFGLYWIRGCPSGPEKETILLAGKAWDALALRRRNIEVAE